MTFYSRNSGYVEGRDLKVDEVMRSWQKKFCTFQDVKICVSTFNVNGRSPPSVFPTWFSHEKNDQCDFYAVGLQEMDLSVGTYIIDNTKKMDEWTDAIKASLPGGRSQYRSVASMRLVGIFVIVFQNIQSKVKVTQISTNYVATGISVLMNKLGNKGGTAISMKMNDTWVCFVNSHFAAGNNELERRNQDFRDIYNLITFNSTKVSIYDHDAVFWFGDLNYRLNSEYAGLSGERVRQIASSENFGDLLQHCQLREQMKRGDVFKDFIEPEKFQFRPTYKYDVGTNTWDTSEKGRVPAWTDRILSFRKYPTVSIELVKHMESVDTITISDHKPVRALFRLVVKTIDENKANQLYEDAIREADRKANDELPQIHLSLHEIDFGEVNYLDPTTRLITVKNIGRSAVRFKFKITPAGRDKICAKWLQVTPTHYEIQQNQSTQISITVSITTDILRDMNGKTPILQDILVLHLENGRDYFIPVTAMYNSRCFGASLEKLLTIKTKKEDNLIDFGDESIDFEDTCPSHIPKPVFQLVSALRHRGASQLNLMEHSDNEIFNRIRVALESGQPSDLSNYAPSFMLYSALIRLLDTLEEPVIPSGMEGMIHYEFVAHARDARALWNVVSSCLPQTNREVLELICRLLRELISENYALKEQLPLWGQILFRFPPQTVNLQSALDPRVVALQTLCEYGRDVATGGR